MISANGQSAAEIARVAAAALVRKGSATRAGSAAQGQPSSVTEMEKQRKGSKEQQVESQEQPRKDSKTKKAMATAAQKIVGQGKSVLILNTGPQNLGQGYPKDGNLGNLQFKI